MTDTHHTSSTLPAYRDALAKAGLSEDAVELRPFVSPYPGMSSAYAALAQDLQRRGRGRILPELLKRVGASLPLGATAFVLAQRYKLLEVETSCSAVLSTALSIFTVSVVMAALAAR